MHHTSLNGHGTARQPASKRLKTCSNRDVVVRAAPKPAASKPTPQPADTLPEWPAAGDAQEPSGKLSKLLRRLNGVPATISSVSNSAVAASSSIVSAGRLRVRAAAARAATAVRPADADATGALLQQPQTDVRPHVHAPKRIKLAHGTGVDDAAGPSGRGAPGLHAVHELMAARLRSGSKPGQRGDGFKLGLAVEGGGMRGIVTGAMLMGLMHCGLRDTVDAVYGASAGAINATYFLTGQPEGLDIYTRELAQGERFLNLRRYWSSDPVMDVGYLLDDVMNQTIPLDWDAAINSQLPLKVVASSLDTLRAEILSDFSCAHDLSRCLHASANVPEIVGPPIEHRGHRLVDAAVFEPVPVRAALADGCTHVLVLCSRPPHVHSAWGTYLRRSMSRAVKSLVLNPPYMREAWAAEATLGTPIEEILRHASPQQRAAGAATSLAGAAPAASSLPSSLFRGALRRGSAAARRLAGWEAAEADAARLEALAASSTDPAAAAAADAATAALLGVDGSGSPVSSSDGCISGSSPGASLDLGGEVGGDEAALHLGASILPIYPGAAAAFAPICKDVPTLEAGRDDGFECIVAAMAPVLAAARVSAR